MSPAMASVHLLEIILSFTPFSALVLFSLHNLLVQKAKLVLLSFGGLEVAPETLRQQQHAHETHVPLVQELQPRQQATVHPGDIQQSEAQQPDNAYQSKEATQNH